MKRTVIITVIFLFLHLSLAFADTSIKAEVDKSSLAINEVITYKITVNSSEKQLSQPQMPEFKDFDIISKLRSSSISWVKGNPTTILTFTFILAPKDVGKFKIEPTVIKIKNETYSTDSFEIEVTQPEKIQPNIEREEPQFTL